jgi:DNA-damage-inducible protein D
MRDNFVPRLFTSWEVSRVTDETVMAELPLDGDGGFESFGHDNGFRFWWQSDLMRLLGYQTAESFRKAVGKAISACTTLGISVPENFVHAKRERDGVASEDCKLSRFACYLTAMNGDPRKPEVARAQAYFATFAEATRQYLLRAENVERVAIRDELSDRGKALVSAANAAGVADYALFQNKGYRGLYNMNLRELKALKGVHDKDKSLLDFMGKEELAANLFRVTQTEAKIKKENVRGQYALETTAFSVGREVRETIKKIGGTMPEDLPPAEDIATVRSGLKRTHRELKKVDKKKLPPKTQQ